MPHTWFRCYSEILDDPKVQMMTEADQRRLIMILAFRCEGKPLETFRETQIAFRLRISLAQLLETKEVFIQNGFIDESWHILNWDKRQYISDSSTVRVRKHREALKQDETLHFDDETFQKHHETENVTTPDTDTDTEQKQKKKQKRQKTLPKDKPSVDERFALFRGDFEKDFRYLNKADAPWDAKEGTRLSAWLKANPKITQVQWRDILRNRRASPVGRGSPLSAWIGKALSWLSGTADEWGKSTKANGNGGGNAAVSNGTGNAIMGVLKETLDRRQRNRTTGKDGDLPAGGEGGFDDPGVVHAIPATAGPESVPSGNEEHLDF